jgi:hypothetical protein
MRELGSVDFFDRLELELRAAAERGPRRRPVWAPPARTVAAVAIASAVVALVLVPAVAFLGSGSRDEPERVTVDGPPGPLPVGSVVRRGGEEHTVVATGNAPVAGPWQMEAYESTRLTDPETGEEYQPAGLPCLGVALLGPTADAPIQLSGGCGEFPRTPGFGRGQISVPPGGRRADTTPIRVKEILVYGRAPEQAASVVLTAEGEVRERVEPFQGPPSVSGDFYLMAIPPDLKNGRVNWLDREGNEGSRGIELLPP